MDIKKNENQPTNINDESKYSIIYNDPIDELDWNNFAEKIEPSTTTQNTNDDVDEPITKKIPVYDIESTQSINGEIIKRIGSGKNYRARTRTGNGKIVISAPSAAKCFRCGRGVCN